MNATSPGSVAHAPQGAVRRFWPDLLRVVSAFAVVLLHAVSDRIRAFDADSPEWWGVVVCRALPSFAVPVFFMLSGMFLLDPARSVGARKILRGCVRFAVAFAVWSAFYSLAFPPHRLYLGQFLKGPVHLWFLPALASCYLAAPALRAIARDRQAEEALLAAVFALLCVSNTLRSLSGAFRRILPTTIAVLSMPAFLELLGDYLHRFPPHGIWRRLFVLGGAGGLFFAILATGLLAKEGKRADFLLGPGQAPVVLFSAAVFVLGQSAFDGAPSGERLRRVVSGLAKCTFGIYLVHRAFLWALPALSEAVVLDIVLRSLVGFALSFAATAILLRTPLLRYAVS